MKRLARMHRKLSVAAAIAAFLLAGSLQPARAALSYSLADSTYLENFDSLPTTPENSNLQSLIPWADDTTSSATQTSLPGWYLYHPTVTTEGGANGHQRIRIGAGTSTTGAFYSFGSSASTERALGALGASTLAPDAPTEPDGANLYIGLRLHNDTGVTLGRFTLGYTGEQWHSGTGTALETMTFGWSTTAATVNDPSTAFNAVPALSWTAQVKLAAEGAVDGNANQVVVSPVTVEGINWAPGTDLWLRWTDPQVSGFRDEGMALDNLTFTASIPEPASTTLLLLGAVTFGLLRRRNRR